jgi:hypothetical protein
MLPELFALALLRGCFSTVPAPFVFDRIFETGGEARPPLRRGG